MTTYTRREFLSICGVTLLAGTLLHPDDLFSTARVNAAVGRTLTPTPLHEGVNGDVIGHLFPDTVVTIRSEQGGWYKLDRGYAARAAIQPMPDWGSGERPIDQLPAMLEVVAPVASVHRYCDAAAPLIARIGHGGVAQAVDWLPGANGGWYALAADEAGSAIGWSQVARWRAVDTSSMNPLIDHLDLNTSSQRMTAYNRTEPIAQFAIHSSRELQAGAHRLTSRQAYGQSTDDDQRYQGVPWIVTWERDLRITGAYWHNRFGEHGNNTQVELPPLAARWLYQNVGEQTQLVVA